ALMILFSGMYNTEDGKGGFIVENLPGVEAGTEFTQYAVNNYLPGMGAGFVAIALLFFAFTTIMAYYYIAETNLNYMYPNIINPLVLFTLRVVLLSVVIFGATRSAGLAWDMGDIGVGIMAWLNIIAILLLRKPALRTLKDFEEQLKAKNNPIFNPKKLDIKNTEDWRDNKVNEGYAIALP